MSEVLVQASDPNTQMYFLLSIGCVIVGLLCCVAAIDASIKGNGTTAWLFILIGTGVLLVLIGIWIWPVPE